MKTHREIAASVGDDPSSSFKNRLFRNWPPARRVLLVVILLGTMLRLFHIDGPPMDHHWFRQYDTAAIARNYAEGSMAFLYPQVDWRGESPGYVESEFPAYSYLVALLYRAWGPREWLARALNIVLYVFSAWVFFFFTRRMFDERAALFAVGFYSSVPLSYFFTRTIQPDAMAAFGTILGIYSFWSWTENRRVAYLVASAMAIAVTVLIKPSNLYLGLPLVYLHYRQFRWHFLRMPIIWLFAAAVTVPAILWYRHAYTLWEVYGNTLIRGYFHLDHPGLADPLFWDELGYQLVQRLLFCIATPPGLLLLVIGVFAKFPRGNRLLLWWGIGFGISIILAPGPHFGHDYYQLPLVFPVAAVMGFGATRILDRQLSSAVSFAAGSALVLALGMWLRYQRDYQAPILIAALMSLPLLALAWRKKSVASIGSVVGLCLMSLGFSVWTSRQWFPDEQWQRNRVAFGKSIDRLTEPDALIIFLIPGVDRPGWFQKRTSWGQILNHDPVDFYLSRRKGWSVRVKQMTPALADTLREKGARYVAYFVGSLSYAMHGHIDMMEKVGNGALVNISPIGALYRLDPPQKKSGEDLESGNAHPRVRWRIADQRSKGDFS